MELMFSDESVSTVSAWNHWNNKSRLKCKTNKPTEYNTKDVLVSLFLHIFLAEQDTRKNKAGTGYTCLKTIENLYSQGHGNYTTRHATLK